MDTPIECFCEKKFSKKQMFSSHFTKCQKIKNKFKDMDSKISRAIKKFVDNLDNSGEKEYTNGLLLLKLLFYKYIYLLDEIINKYIKVKNFKFNSDKKEIKNDLNINTNFDNMNIERNIPIYFQSKLPQKIGTNNNVNSFNDNSNKTKNIINDMINKNKKSNQYYFYNKNDRNNIDIKKSMIYKNDSNNMDYGNDSNQMEYVNNPNNTNNIYYLNDFNPKFPEIFKNANAKYTEFNMKKNKSSQNMFQNQEYLEEKITIIFSFLTDHQEKVKAKLDEIFYDVFKRFHEMQCPPDLKQYICYAFHNNKLIDNNKTLKENGIKNGDTILFNRTDENYNEEKEVEEKNEEDEKEKILLIQLWTEEHGCIMKNNLLLYNQEQINKFNLGLKDYINKKYMQIGIKTKEHEHKLIYCKTNFNWTCSQCALKESKTVPRLFCSICNYNMCNYCRKIKKYYKIGNIPYSAFPTNNKINNLFIVFSRHEHRLAYCRTKRTSYNILGWVCNNCKEKFNEKTWTFYCTKCDYDLCSNCAQNENLI